MHYIDVLCKMNLEPRCVSSLGLGMRLALGRQIFFADVGGESDSMRGSKLRGISSRRTGACGSE